MKDKKGQTLIITLWILVILTILAVSIGNRVSFGLRLSNYQANKLKALCLAKAGISRAIVELKKDTNNYDAINESWAYNEEAFKKIVLDEQGSGFASVSYVVNLGENKYTIYGAADEERKININTATKDLLEQFLKGQNVVNSEVIANNICAWRGDLEVEIPEYSDLGYPNKGKLFTNIYELILVKDLDSETYDKITSSVTVYGEGKVNINTTDEMTLNALIEYCRAKITNGENDPGDLSARIMQLRFQTYFTSFDDLKTKLKEQSDLTSGQINILNEMPAVADFKSTCFSIVSNGKMIHRNISAVIKATFDRKKNKIIYWHES